jgi:two-component system, sensor histidine kinase LadS
LRSLLKYALLSLAICVAAPCASATNPVFSIQALESTTGDPTPAIVTSGAVDAQFTGTKFGKLLRQETPFWLRLRALQVIDQPGATVAIAKGRLFKVDLYANAGSGYVPVPQAIALAAPSGVHEALCVLPRPLAVGETLYVHVVPEGSGGAQYLHFSITTLAAALAESSEHTRMIAIAVGALLAMASTALLVWFVLSDRLLIFYASLFSIQAIYITYLTGEGFDWPLLRVATPLEAYAWNVPAALSGAMACLFAREIAELRRLSPKVYSAFGWLAAGFVVLAFANFADLIGLGGVVVAFGNLMFAGSAIFTLVAAFLAWRQGVRAAGWFLLAWGLLETVTVATAIELLTGSARDVKLLLYYALPLSMVAAAVLIALGVADRLRDQRRALSEAERRAQTDPLTGVFNRRTLIERLETISLRARSRGQAIALLFLDLDHFKEINDTFGHAAGDACLRAIIEPIQSELRPIDMIGRYGGEEFVVILTGTDVEMAKPIAERIRERVAELSVGGFGKPIRLTCSIGVAASDSLGVWGEHLIASADAAVYDAKRAGRNCVQIALAA